MSDTVDSISLGIVVLFLAVFVVIPGLLGFMGISSMRAESTYTGYVVDVEHDKGVLFRTSQIHLKTHPRSSAVEEFCIHPSNEKEQLEKARQYLQQGEKVDVTYHRPLYVSHWQCEAGLSLVDSLDSSGDTE